VRYYSTWTKVRNTAVPILLSLILWAAIIIGVLALAGCTPYNPDLYPSYDVLNPGEDVRRNPLGFNADGNLIVTPSFIAWVDELKQEVIKLRRQIK